MTGRTAVLICLRLARMNNRNHSSNSSFGHMNGSQYVTEVERPGSNLTTYERTAGTNTLTAIEDALGRRTEFTYDSNGNLTSFTDASGTTTYTWNARNQLTAISGPGLTASFIYDGLGRRSSVTVNSATTGFWYDGDDILAELTGTTSNVTYLRGLRIDQPFIRQLSGGNEFYQTDALGTSVVLTDPTGTTQTTYSYEPFGKATVSGPSTNFLRYTGREADGTGLLYYRARYYSPRLQRFVSEDPIGLRGGDPNFYAYVGNNPTRFTDPQGLFIGRVHRKIAYTALRLEGCSDSFNKMVAEWDVKADTTFPTFDPRMAPIHGQQDPNFTLQANVIYNWDFINKQLGKGNPEGLGYAMHATEDPFSRSHQWTEALSEPSALDPQHWGDWMEHGYYDAFPGDEFWHAVEADRRIIRRWKAMSGRKDACQ